MDFTNADSSDVQSYVPPNQKKVRSNLISNFQPPVASSVHGRDGHRPDQPGPAGHDHRPVEGVEAEPERLRRPGVLGRLQPVMIASSDANLCVIVCLNKASSSQRICFCANGVRANGALKSS